MLELPAKISNCKESATDNFFDLHSNKLIEKSGLITKLSDNDGQVWLKYLKKTGVNDFTKMCQKYIA